MHNPYESSGILNLNTPIESLAVYDDAQNDYILTGTREGHLMIYTVLKKDHSSSESSDKEKCQLLRYNKFFYKKAIQQLSVVPQFNLVIVLVDNTVHVHDLSSTTLPFIMTLEKTKNAATLFSLNIENHTGLSLTREQSYIVRLCVAVKKKLILFYWKNKEFLEFKHEIIINDVPKSLAWCKGSICVGFRAEYCLIDVEDNKQKELFPNGKNPEPHVIKLDHSTFALVRDTQTVFVDTFGSTLKNAVKWSGVPLSLIYDEPYIIALLSDKIEVRTIQPNLMVQEIKVTNAQSICQCSPGVLYVSVGQSIHKIKASPVSEQIEMLLKTKEFQLALKLCKVSNCSEEEKKAKINEIKTLYAFNLFQMKKYKEAIDQFKELESDPQDVIRLYPSLLPQNTHDEASSSSYPHLNLPDDPLPVNLQISKSQNRDLEKSLTPLIEYLTETRLKLLDKTMFQIIDTTLLKCYLYTNDALIAPLLRLNNCNIVEAEKVLKKHKKYSELIILYQTNKLHYKALELLEKQASQADSSLRGHEHTIQYLQNLGKEYIDTILRFSGWVLEKHPEDGLKIFTEDLIEVEQLPRIKVLDFLTKTNKNLVIPYLEHVIHVWNDTDALLHKALIRNYLEQVLQLLNGSQAEKAQGEILRNKLTTFLEKSEHYTPDTVLAQFPLDKLYEERAVLYGKLGRHEKALSIYVTQICDIEKAVHYCDRVFKDGKKGSDEVYVILLRLLIDPPESGVLGNAGDKKPQPDVEMALTLLEGNAAKIPPVKALQILPSDTPVHKIKHYLAINISEFLDRKRKNQILRGLLYAEYLQVQEQRIFLESQKMSLTEWNVCPVCKKRFSNQSAFIRNPNGDVIHFSCQEQNQQGDSK